MNVIFHTTAAIGIASICFNSRAINNELNTVEKIIWPIAGFLVGVISHGALDYIPHCYPVDSKVDAIASFLIMLFLVWKCQPHLRIILSCVFFGAVFPDVIDHTPAILNKFLGSNFSIYQKFFPWHWEEYSGSIFETRCFVSTINHILLLITVGTIVFFNRVSFIKVFS